MIIYLLLSIIVLHIKLNYTHTYIYIYILVMSKLARYGRPFIFSLIKSLKIFNNAGAGLGLATPFTTAASLSFFLEKYSVYLDAELIYDHIKWETFQTRTLTSPPRQERIKRGRKRYCAHSAHSSNTCTKVPARATACIISYQTAKETTCMQCRSYAVS